MLTLLNRLKYTYEPEQKKAKDKVRDTQQSEAPN